MTRDSDSSKTVYSAVALFDDTRAERDYEQYFDDEELFFRGRSGSEDKDGAEAAMPLFGVFKNHSLMLGLLVGFFVQFSTLGANFLVIVLWENDLIHKSKSEIVMLSLVWSAFTSFMAILTLGFLRSVVTIVFRASVPRDCIDREAILEEVVLHLECRFVVGALVGVCMAWTATDVLLGMNIQIIFSLATLAVSLLWCKLMMYCFTKDDRSLINLNTIETKSRAIVVV
jgi:hypothetical protein